MWASVIAWWRRVTFFKNWKSFQAGDRIHLIQSVEFVVLAPKPVPRLRTLARKQMDPT